MERTRNVMFPSSKKKRLCRVNRLIPVDRGVLVSVDSNGKLDGWEEILSPMVSLDKSEGAVMMVDADGDSDLVIGMVWGYWSKCPDRDVRKDSFFQCCRWRDY